MENSQDNVESQTQEEPPIDSNDFDATISLIEAVESRPPLYQQQLETHKDRNLKDKLWREVAAACNHDVKWCMDKWKSLKGYYYIKKKQLAGKSGKGGRKAKPWAYYASMQFLDGILTFNPETTTNMNLVDSDNEVEMESSTSFLSTGGEDIGSETENSGLNERSKPPGSDKKTPKPYEPPQKKSKPEISAVDQTIIKLLAQDPGKNGSNNLADGPHHFCMNLADRLRKLPEAQRAFAEMRFMQIMYEVEYPMYQTLEKQ